MAESLGVLGQIAERKRDEVSARFAGVSLDGLRGRARPTRRSLSAALTRPGARFILEIKKASPSEGRIRAQADAAELARGYAGVGDALSVLTDESFFGGSLGDLIAARREFDGPILGLLVTRPGLNETDDMLGSDTTAYPNIGLVYRGMELRATRDWVRISADLTTIFYKFRTGDYTDQVRVIVGSPVPTPASAVMLLTGGLVSLGRRRRS